MQLQALKTDFDRAGFTLVALTYDAPDLQAAFIEAESIEFPILSDRAAASVQALGILNEAHQPGDDHYGIPHPGILIVDRQLRIRSKLFVAPYERRVEGETVLALAKALVP